MTADRRRDSMALHKIIEDTFVFHCTAQELD